MIELNNLSCAYKTKTILTNISLTLENHITVLGANGSGKSTLAKAITNLIEYKGEIKIDKKNIKNISLLEKAKLLSYIPAKLEIYDPFISVFEFVLQGRFPHKDSFKDYTQKDKDKTLQTLEFLNISHLKESSMHSLSSGEQQLTLIAQALSTESKIIIFDEPTANLDPYNSKIIAGHIKALKEKHTIILITHDLHLACYIDSAILFIKDKTAYPYQRDFFDDAKLQELYGVEFHALAVKYA